MYCMLNVASNGHLYVAVTISVLSCRENSGAVGTSAAAENFLFVIKVRIIT